MDGNGMHDVKFSNNEKLEKKVQSYNAKAFNS